MMGKKKEKYYKYLNKDGRTPQGFGKYPMPRNGKPGRWHKVEGELIACENGLHVLRAKDLLDWEGPLLWEVEVRGEVVPADDKDVVREIRLLRKVMGEREWRLFACDSAARILRKHGRPVDERSVEAIRVARLYADGKATNGELAAARDAAWASAWFTRDDRNAEYKWRIARLKKYISGTTPRPVPLPKADR